MSPQELHTMIQLIKTLPDSLLIRVIRAATAELLTRTDKLFTEIREELDKD